MTAVESLTNLTLSLNAFLFNKTSSSRAFEISCSRPVTQIAPIWGKMPATVIHIPGRIPARASLNVSARAFLEGNVAAAAFYDLEGTLVSTNLVHTLGFYAKNQQGLFRTFKKSASTLLSIPIFAVTDQYSRKVFNDLFFKRYKGESEDRLRFFAEELFEDVLKPAVYPGTFELIEKSRSLGLRQVVVTGALDLSVTPLMKYLGIDDYVANRLEFVNGVATGRLLPPVLAAATKASWIRTFAEREGISLSDSYAYTDSMSDLPMLSVVGHPAAVNPDMRLKQTALHHDWPILNLK
jgi:HAD superfamily hydrolase (TIGR01490 family)